MSTCLKVVSYNIHKGLDVANRRYVLRRIRAGLRSIEPDIVLLQEIVDTHRRYARRFIDWVQTSQFDYLAEDFWPHNVFGENAVHDLGSHGNAILSRYPIIRHHNIDISYNRLEQRGILHAEIELPPEGPRLHVCCLHLNLLNRHRRRQLALLCDEVRARVPEDAPLVIGGDFNDWRARASAHLARAIGASESHFELHGRHARTFPAWRPVLMLDRIYYRNLSVRSAGDLNGPPWRGLSDHLPVVSEFEIDRERAAA